MGLRGRSQLEFYDTYFVTTSTVDLKCYFKSASIMGRVRDILFYSVKCHRTKLFGYVIMKNHIHLLMKVHNGGKGLSVFMRDFKMSVSRKLFRDRGRIWSAGFHDVVVISRDVFNTKLLYIHENQVRANYVARPVDWEFSSASAWLSDSLSEDVSTDWDTD